MCRSEVKDSRFNYLNGAFGTLRCGRYLTRPEKHTTRNLRKKPERSVQKEIQEQSARKAKSRPIQKGVDSSTATI
jgi:hypothetical protein